MGSRQKASQRARLRLRVKTMSMWRWHKVRRAKIDPGLRERFEFFGETLVVLAIESGDANRIGRELAKLGQRYHLEAVEWLRERRDVAARHEDRVETVEWAILIFVVLGVFVEFANLIWFLTH
jgi:hypothetical protein